MARKPGHTGSQQFAAHVAEWLDGKLLPVLGPPPLGPYGADDAQPPAAATCPLCGDLLSVHRLEHEGTHTFLHCPNGVTQIETGRAA